MPTKLETQNLKVVAETSYYLANSDSHSSRSRIAATHAADQFSNAERGSQEWLAFYDQAKEHLLLNAIGNLLEGRI